MTTGGYAAPARGMQHHLESLVTVIRVRREAAHRGIPEHCLWGTPEDWRGRAAEETDPRMRQTQLELADMTECGAMWWGEELP